MVCVCVVSLHSGDVPEERDESRRFLYDSEEPAGGAQPLQTGESTWLNLGVEENIGTLKILQYLIFQ